MRGLDRIVRARLTKAALLALVALGLTACGSSGVPDVTGQPFDEASERLRADGYEVEKEEVSEQGAEVGTVLRTRPRAGEDLEEGEVVVVEVAEEPTLTGTVTIAGSATGNYEGDCQGSGGYSDLRPGTTVVVKDGSGTTLATGNVLGGQVDEDRSKKMPMPALENPWTRIVCVLSFAVPGIPEADFYEVEVGRRGGLTYSFDEIEAQDWKVELVLD